MIRQDIDTCMSGHANIITAYHPQPNDWEHYYWKIDEVLAPRVWSAMV